MPIHRLVLFRYRVWYGRMYIRQKAMLVREASSNRPTYIPCTSTQEVESKLNINIELPGGMRSKEVEREAMVVYGALHAEHHE